MGDEAGEKVGSGAGWGWGGWGSSAFSVLSELQKAAGEVSKTAVAAAKSAVDGVAGLQNSLVEEGEEAEEEEDGDYVALKRAEDLDLDNAPAMLEPVTGLDEQLRKTSLDKLEAASKESILGHGLKVLDDSVESLTSGAFQALETAWKGGVNLVQKFEVSAEQLAGSLQQTGSGITAKAGSLAPQLIESSRALTAKGIHVLEMVGRETMEILATETGIELEEDGKETDGGDRGDDEEFADEVSFDRCFYIYGGPEHMEELEALSNHHSLLCNRARAKLSGEQRASFDTLLKQLHHTLFRDNIDGVAGSFKGKNVDLDSALIRSEVKSLREASVAKAKEMATGLGPTLAGLAVAEIVQKTADRLEEIRTEGVHRVSELCALCISQLLQLGNSVLATSADEKGKALDDGIDWPAEGTGKAALLEAQAQALVDDIQLVSKCFISGLVDVIAGFNAAVKSDAVVAKGDAELDILKDGFVEEKAAAVGRELKLHSDAAAEKVHEGLKHLTPVVLWTCVKN